MISSKRYVEEDSQGVLRVGPLGVSLDSVVIAFQQGHFAETIQQLYPALSLEEVYGSNACFLALISVDSITSLDCCPRQALRRSAAGHRVIVVQKADDHLEVVAA